MTPISDTVQAAIYYAKYTDCDLSEYCWACHKLEREITDQDRLRISPSIAAAARILAAEVERLRGAQPQTIVLSDCCEKPVMFGKTGSTQWYGCPECCQPCDVFYQDNKPTQP